MNKEQREYVAKLEKANQLLKERIKYLEERLKYEDAVKAINPPSNDINF